MVKQWRRGQPFQQFNRLEICDKKKKWLEAFILTIQTKESFSNRLEDQIIIKVHFKGYAAKWDEEIVVWESPGVFSTRILEIGATTKAHGAAKYD